MSCFGFTPNTLQIYQLILIKLQKNQHNRIFVINLNNTLNMEPLELGKFIVQAIQTLGKILLPFTVCKKGYGVIKCRFGQPVKWRNKPNLYFKWPIIDTFDKVDIRKKYLFVNAHSFHSPDMEKSLIPYNIVIDVQVEYQVVNPLVIYDEYGFNEGEEANISYVNNTVQGILSEIIEKYGIGLNYNTLVTEIRKMQEKHKKEPLSIDKIKTYDNKHKSQKTTRVEECISISNIVVTSFDKNISIRTTN